MEQTNEDIVTKILSNHEIILRNYAEEVYGASKNYVSNPKYDLTYYLNNNEPEQNRFDNKYLFVK